MDVDDRFSYCHKCAYEGDYYREFEIVALGDSKPFIIRPRAYKIHLFEMLEEMERFESIVNGNPIKYVPEGGDKSHFFMTRCKKCGAFDHMEITKDKSTCHACLHEDHFTEIGKPDYDLYEFKTEADMSAFKTHYTGRP